ncbi:hypothetical protein GQ54DRAFT_295071 [Martensiomyces pterosporus]|nr:hypothetical protein GQ54DRAFT_295071 [Martensiomyces pterosporus]
MVKKFIDKKHAKTYKLVYRSQEDPLAFEEGASDRVFVQVGRSGAPKSRKGKDADQTFEQSLDDLKLDDIQEEDLDRQAGEAALYGVYLDDREYDYTKHLRKVGGGGGVLLEAPSLAKGEKMDGEIQFADEEDGHMVNAEGSSRFTMPRELLPSSHRMNIKAEAFPTGIQPNMDLDVREALEALEEDDVEELDEDFLDQLNADEPPSGEEDEEGGFEGFDDEDEDFDPNDVFAQVRRMKAQRKQYDSDDDLDEDEYENASGSGWRTARTASTGFSMSSSAMYRNEKLTLLDEQFDQIEAIYEQDEEDSEEERYDENGHGVVEYDSDGNPKPMSTRPDFEDVLDEFLSEFELTGKKLQVKVEGGDGAGKLGTYRDAFLSENKSRQDGRKDVLAAGMRIIEEDSKRSEKDDDMELEMQFREKERTPWDCQTILTTYSTLDNHPATIHEDKRTPKIRVSRKTGFPMVEGASVEHENEDAEMHSSDEEEDVKENKGRARNKGETKEDKRARKQKLKEEKKSRREQKRETRGVFADKMDRKMQSKKDRAQYVVRLD